MSSNRYRGGGWDQYDDYPAETIFARRTAQGLTQQELAVQVGVFIDSVRAWERGRKRPSRYNQVKIDEVLGPPERVVAQ